jgi:hypothetical protein
MIHVEIPRSVVKHILREGGSRASSVRIDQANVGQCLKRFFRAVIASANPTRSPQHICPERPTAPDRCQLEYKATQCIATAISRDRELGQFAILLGGKWDFPLPNPDRPVVFVDPVIERGHSGPSGIVVSGFQHSQTPIRHGDNNPGVPRFTSQCDPIYERPERIRIAQQEDVPGLRGVGIGRKAGHDVEIVGWLIQITERCLGGDVDGRVFLGAGRIE